MGRPRTADVTAQESYFEKLDRLEAEHRKEFERKHEYRFVWRFQPVGSSAGYYRKVRERKTEDGWVRDEG